MTHSKNPMEIFHFLLGDWKMDYRIPESSMHKAETASAAGIFQRTLDDKAVVFDYAGSTSAGERFSAHGIFLWDEKTQIIRYWWFESSAASMTADCEFIDDDTLYMSWHDSLLTQTFKKINADQVILRMGRPRAQDKYELLLEVTFTRK